MLELPGVEVPVTVAVEGLEDLPDGPEELRARRITVWAQPTRARPGYDLGDRPRRYGQGGKGVVIGPRRDGARRGGGGP